MGGPKTDGGYQMRISPAWDFGSRDEMILLSSLLPSLSVYSFISQVSLV